MPGNPSNTHSVNDDQPTVQTGAPMVEERFVMPNNFEPVSGENGAEIPNLFKSKDEDKYFWRNPLTGELTELNVQSNGPFRVGKLILQGFENEKIRTIALLTVILMFMIDYKAKVSQNGQGLAEQGSVVRQDFAASNMTTDEKLIANSFLDHVHNADSATQSAFMTISIILCISGFAGTFRRSLEGFSENANALKSSGTYSILAFVAGVLGLMGNAAATVNSLISPENTMNYLWLNKTVHNEAMRPLVYLFMATFSGYAFEGICHFAGLSQKAAAEQEAGIYNNALKAGSAAWNHAKRATHERYAGFSNAFWGGNQFEQAERLNKPYASMEPAGYQDSAAAPFVATEGQQSRSGYSSI